MKEIIEDIGLSANKLLNYIGPGRFLLISNYYNRIVNKLRLLGCYVHQISPLEMNDFKSDKSYSAIILGNSGISYFLKAPFNFFNYCRALKSKYIILCPSNIELLSLDNAKKKQFWAMYAINLGYRRFPGGYTITEYNNTEDDLLSSSPLILEYIDDDLIKKYPLEKLLSNRELHMDMLREYSPRADAHIVRYSLASKYIRPADTVLDCACGLGYGCAILACQSRAKRIIGVDIDKEAINYAIDMYGKKYSIEFYIDDAQNLSNIEDNSIDTIVSFETIEHILNYKKMLQEFRRVLKPDGRVILSAPNLWVNENGIDENPYHVTVFDWNKLRGIISDNFIIESRYRQEAPGGVKLVNSKKNILEVSLDTEIDDTEWWIVIASSNPLIQYNKNNIKYMHPYFTKNRAGDSVLVDFENYYVNPWIYRTIVQLGERITNTEELINICLKILEKIPYSTADFGAAATIIGYKMLEKEDRGFLLEEFLNIAKVYTCEDTENPHIIRWQISLSYVSALLCMYYSKIDNAIIWFNQVLKYKFKKFSPLISTKLISACFWLAIIYLVKNEKNISEQYLKRAIIIGKEGLEEDIERSVGNIEYPLPFAFQELAEICDMVSQCVIALENLDIFNIAPGRFWSLVDVKRFGLSTWAQHLELENEKLRKIICKLKRNEIERYK